MNRLLLSKTLLVCLTATFIAPLAFSSTASAQNAPIVQSLDDDSEPTFMDEFDPFAADAEETLKAYDEYYQSETGESPFLSTSPAVMLWGATCYRISCPVWIRVNKATQTLSLYLNGSTTPVVYLVSTGIKGRNTPNFDTHPDGRIYNKYTSSKYPGGDYNGLGNMPYAVFISGGFAIHGTPKGNWVKLGKQASHGCIRVHPDNAKYINQLVRANGVSNVWITVDQF